MVYSLSSKGSMQCEVALCGVLSDSVKQLVVLSQAAGPALDSLHVLQPYKHSLERRPKLCPRWHDQLRAHNRPSMFSCSNSFRAGHQAFAANGSLQMQAMKLA